MLATSLSSMAQGELKDGVWEEKQVVQAEGVTAPTLYLRALEALSDWAGSQEKSKIGIDVQDKDEGLVVYKGELFLGFEYYSKFAGAGWDCFANFTMKVKCKDGRAQISVMVPSMTFKANVAGSVVTRPINEFLPDYSYKGDYKLKKMAPMAHKIEPSFEGIIKKIGEQIANGTNDDDF